MGAAVRTTPSYGRIRNRRPQATHHPSARYAAPRRPPSTCNHEPGIEARQFALLQALLRREADGHSLDFMLIQLPGPLCGLKPAIDDEAEIAPIEADFYYLVRRVSSFASPSQQLGERPRASGQ
jgi:hypothetical protein